MKVKYLPASPKSGTTEHLPMQTAALLIAAGFAEEVKMPMRGAPGWVEARLEQSRMLAGTGDSLHDTQVPFVYPATWTLETLPVTMKPCIAYRSGSEVSRFHALYWFDARGKKHDAIPPECPASLRKQFAEQLDACSPERQEAARERVIQAQIKQDSSSKSGTVSYFGKLGISVPSDFGK